MTVTGDGCPVEAYARMPAEPDLSVVLGHLAGLRSVLDLGAGAGRIADPLVDAGYEVLAVDESPAMLRRIARARTHLCTIESLDLQERFDAVLLLSHLINDADHLRRTALLGAAERHLTDDGVLIVQRLDPAHEVRPGQSRLGDVGLEVDEVDTAGWPIVRAVTRYRVGRRTWSQPWTARVLDDRETTNALAVAGLPFVTMNGAWTTARRRQVRAARSLSS